MVEITKAAFARELGISKARVSQYIARGLPVRVNGRLDREMAVKWIADNHVGRGLQEAPGVKRAGQIVRTFKPKAPDVAGDPVGDAMLATAVAIMMRAGPIAAEMAVELGLPMRVAYALDQMVAVKLSEVAEAFLDQHGFRFAESRRDLLEELGPEDATPDWPALAEKAGEPLDLDAWGDAADALPFFAPPSHV